MHTALDDPVPSRGRAIYDICIIAPCITGLIVFLRAYSRFFITKRNYPADWCAYVTLIWVAAFSGTLVPATYWGMGRHIWDFSTEQTQNMTFWIMVSSAFYVLSLVGYKMALLLLYLQLFGVSRTYRYILYAVMFYTCGYLLCNLILEFAGCQPIEKFYRPKTPGHCTNTTAQNIAFGVGHMTSDLMIAILPLPMILRLQLRSVREKVGLCLVLGTGVVAWVVACTRFIYATVDLTSADRTWLAGITFFLSVLEVNTGLICASLPSLKPLLINVRDASSEWSRKHSLSDWSRKRSLGYSSRKRSEPFGPDEKKPSGLVGFRQVHSDSTKSSETAAADDVYGRATFARRPTDPEHELEEVEAPEQTQSTGEKGSRLDKPLPQPRGVSSMHWDRYSITRAFADRHSRPVNPSMDSDELFAGTGMQPAGPKSKP